MPIKLPKGFARRKSSGNALEEVENPPQSSFKVFERPSADKKSSSDGNLMSKRLSEGQPLYSPSEDDGSNIFSASENHHSRNSYDALPTTLFYYQDGAPPIEAQSPHSRNLYEIPIPPISGALRAAGRTFSFGGRFSKTSAAVPQSQSSISGPSRNRAMTASTTSTATAPRLPETELQFNEMEDDFQNMFGSLEKRYYTPQDSSQERALQPDSSAPRKSGHEGPARKDERVPRPTPIDTDRSQEVEPSPYSWDSRHSEDGLLAAIDSPREQLGRQHARPEMSTVSAGERPRSAALPHVVSFAAATTSHRSLDKPQTASDKGLRRSVIYTSKRDSAPVDDEDAKLIMESLYSGKKGVQVLSTSDKGVSDAENESSLFQNEDLSVGAAHTEHQGPPTLVGPAEHNNLDASIAAHAHLAAQYERYQPTSASSANKIMTPSQFEHYRQQQELRRSTSDASISEKSGESDYEEEDETEKNREAERQRRKQEAHLSVYRQQMMKVTGQQSSAPALPTDIDRASKSAPNLLQQGNLSGSGKSSDGDDDEEIPLGILAAHGFPNRNRPPSRLTPSNSIPNLRNSFQQPYISSPGSAAEQDMANRSSLPVFARNLPRDPYFGASLVNPSNRESLALGGGASVHGGQSPALPPGGLVGVIATEERARAMRRGSPNTQAMYDYQAGGVSGSAVHPGGIPRPYTMMNLNSTTMTSSQPSISATEQAQIQLSQQMTQMVQMQMQWMQQMIQIQGGQNVPQTTIQGGPLPGLGASVNMRPSSMPSADTMSGASPGHQADHRTLSMLDPNASSRLNAPALPYASGALRPGTPAGQGYAPSIAPSERSNVGLASRYRPVSTMQPDPGASTLHSTFNSCNDENEKLSAVVPAGLAMSNRPLSSHNPTPTHPKPSNSVAVDDDDDDEGWAEMMKKREDKRNNWRMKKETSSFGDLLNAVH
ncbi:uncharacterized protein BO95DRAFT_436357 [Aspergillus brunneoviolaceus CBS 621.78]|uniref:Uncharacterized protein n=1 Tax=Aspergillus brunneoviolaceus CBS 621.78 TaxID=1450534 RepID=A0ACD1FV14_9EURO|nr:hypothetical protein BO95DRAFT_436357 [Aspergillus brunneoviolaceus CBS 621.78]RAH40804.1 hypothetical protein BO95DRAFT_436357 [Aspergillus brunneoviolaceus CBS 621.78]